jgi:hypothetical protein
MKLTVCSFVYRSLLALSIVTLAACAPAPTAIAPTPSVPPTALPAPTSAPTPLPLPSATPTAIPTLTSAPATSTPEPAATLPQPVVVKAFCTLIGQPKQTDVAANTPVTLVWGWDAKTEAQINDFLENNLTTITFDGQVVTVIKQSPTQINSKTGRYEVVWTSDVGRLSPGQHTILYDVKWKKLITDGANSYGPGSKTETLHDECDIAVK